MIIKSNVHVHCTWCDGKNTAEEMVIAAINSGFTDLGFSSHSYTPFDPTCPGVLDEDGYINEINSLKQKYHDKINIVLGTEQDYYSPVDKSKYRYIVGSVHYIEVANGKFMSVDSSLEDILNLKKIEFNNDGIELAREFYRISVDSVAKYKPDIIGHFDLLTKFNKDGIVFDETSTLYKEIALEAMGKILEIADSYGGLVEVNTGAFARRLREVPYPAPFILEFIASKKGRVIITGDSHSAEAINAGFEEALDIIKQAGFSKLTMLSNKEFAEFDI